MTTTTQEQLRVARADAAGDEARWEAFVRAAPDASFCHLAGWGRIIEDVLGREYIPLVAVTPDGEWRGVMPLVRVRSRLLSHALISMPYLNYGGPIGTPAAQHRLLEAAVREAAASRAGSLQVRCRTAVVEPTDGATRKVMVLLDLPRDPDELWNGFPAKLRSQIRRPMKEGMVFRAGPDQLDAFYRIFARNMRDLGTPVYARRFFEAMAATFPELAFGAVYHRGEPLCAGAGFVWRGEFEMTWASCIRDYNRLAPNMLLYWSFMRAMIERGVDVFNFGRSTPGAGTHRFKQQWGGRDVPLPWIDWSPRHGTGAVAGGAGPSLMARVASTAWRRLPLGVANRLGPPLASRLPWW